MPWSGSGVFTRAYASWTADASSNLPISATKFDLEDNDFAAGIQNCLTIDNQNKPNTTLTWAQTLNLTKGTDANIFSIARTGGTNNPGLTWSLQDAANTVTARLATGNTALILAPASYTFGNVTDVPLFTFVGQSILSEVQATTQFAFTSFPVVNGISGSAFLNSNGVLAGAIGIAGAAAQLTSNAVAGDLVLKASNGNLWFSINGGTTSSAGLTTGGVWEISDNAPSNTLFPAGFLGLPQNSQNNNYTAILSDRAKQLYHNSGSAHTFTIPANASVAYALGDVLHFVNPTGGGTLTIAINSDTLTLVPTGTTGSRTLLAPGVATAEKITSNSWIIYGSNLS